MAGNWARTNSTCVILYNYYHIAHLNLKRACTGRGQEGIYTVNKYSLSVIVKISGRGKCRPAVRHSEKVLAFAGMGDDERSPAPAGAPADIEVPVAPEVLGACKGVGSAADRAAGGRGVRQCVPPFPLFLE